jgi:hypothetical protein
MPMMSPGQASCDESGDDLRNEQDRIVDAHQPLPVPDVLELHAALNLPEHTRTKATRSR